MDADPIKPLSFPVPAENAPVKRRAVFSDSVAQSQSRHVRPAEGGQTMPARRRRLHDDSLKLIDDLTNRPMDPLFSDSRLDQRPRSRLSTWATKFLVFAMCITVGFYGSLFIERLHSDPRKVVRQSLASELRETRGQADTLMNEVNNLRNQVTERSKKLGGTGEDSTLVNDEMVNGLVAVEGPGISLTLADPIAAGSDGASTPRESSGMQIRVVTDADLRLLVRLLWQAGRGHSHQRQPARRADIGAQGGIEHSRRRHRRDQPVHNPGDRGPRHAGLRGQQVHAAQSV